MKKIISVFLITALLLTCFSGCLFKRKDAKEDGKKTTANVKGPERGPVGVWDIPVPEINPLGSQGLYTGTSYTKGSHNLKYIENFTDNQKTAYGEIWTLQVTDTSGIPLEFLKEYVAELGGNIFSSAFGDRLTFTYSKDENSLWWGDAMLEESGYTLTVVNEPRVPAGKEMKFSTAVGQDEDDPSVTFVTQTNGKKFQSAEIYVPSGELHLELTGIAKTGILTRNVFYRRDLSALRSNRFVLDDLPQTSDPLTWSFRWDDGQAPGEFTFKLNELGDIPEVKQGDELGLLRVRGVPFGNAAVEPQNGIEYEYGQEYSLVGDLTPEGDTIFWLPAGYWNVMLPIESTGLDSSISRLVPVNPGQETVLTIPDSLNSAFTTLSQYYAEPGELTGGIVITETKDEGATATISMLVEDPQNRDVFPDKNNTVITESGKQVEILDISRQIAPPSVVLVLDSSGSMGSHMAATIESAKKFINGLPDKTYIKVIDFDSTVRVLKGDTKDAVIKSLSSVTASGSTVLFDATIEGIQLLEGKTRPAVVLFADGADSSIDGQGEGSASTKEDVIDYIKEAGIPLYTIGFREGADKQALKDFAAASGGEYYDAKDNKALDKVFEAIGSKFGNSFVMKYKRPTESALSDKPVISLILDASESMDTDPAEEEGCGFRMDKTKALFHDFIMNLPEQSLFQITSFQTGVLGGNIIKQQQVTTDDKVKMLNGLGALEAVGGTPILDAIRTGYLNLISVPTSKRVMVFMTDAALEVDEEDQAQFEKLLEEIKKDNILVLWAGMGVEDKKDVFEKAARLSGGRYVVSEDSEGLRSSLEEILGMIAKESGSANVPLTVSINEQTASGAAFKYAASMDVEFSRPAKSGKAADPQPVMFTSGTAVKRHDKDIAAKLTGVSMPGEESIMTRRVSYNKKAKNNAMEITAKDAFYFDKFRGLDAPDGKCFLALELDLKNVTSKNITYEIPSIQNHFYITINNNGTFPASDATWLAEKPIAVPGDPAITIQAGQSASGMMVFLVPSDPVSQASLHFYDTSEGHIHIPLAGRMSTELLQLDNMPTAAPANITDAFSMKITAVKDTPAIDIYNAAEKTAFRVIEAQFDSKVQALLDIEPAERFMLKIDTNSGSLMTRLSNATAALPFGFMSPVKLAPSSVNKVRFAYPVAKALSGAKSTLWADLQDASLELPIVQGKAYGNTVNKPSVSSQGLQLRVNQLTTLDEVEGFGSGWVVADVTFTCPTGTEGAVIPEDIFCLVREDIASSGSIDLSSVTRQSSNRSGGDGSDEEDQVESEDSGEAEEAYEDDESYEDEESYEEDDEGSASTGGIGLGSFGNTNSMDGVLLPEGLTANLLYGIDESWAVYSGMQRRGLALFALPDDEHNWILKSNYFTDLNEPLTKSAYAASDLLVEKTDIRITDDEFEQKLAEAVKKAEQKYQSYKSAEGGAGYTKTIDFTQPDGKNHIPVPTIVTHGVTKLRSVKEPSQVFSTMQSLKWLPSVDSKWNYRYSPEAVLTQGWGTEWDLGYLASGLLAKCGIVPQSRLLVLTAEGKARLKELSGVNELKTEFVPGLAYNDGAGSKLLVIPFMKDISELEGLVYITTNQDIDEYTPVEAKITVWAMTESKGNTASTSFNDMAGVLGGGGDSSTTILEDAELTSMRVSLADLSTDTAEIGFIEAGKGEGNLYTAAVSAPGGQQSEQYSVDSGMYRIIGLKVDIEVSDAKFTHVSSLPENDTPDRVYMNVAVNLPDLPEDAAKSLEAASSREYNAAKDPSALSALGWYGRNIINRFITGQTLHDKEVGGKADLTLGRTSNPRCIVVSSRLGSKDGVLRTSMDLLQSLNQCHNGDKETQLAYNVGAGLYASLLEGEVIPGDKNTNFQKLWQSAPSGTRLVYIPGGTDREAYAGPMREYGFPERLISSVENTQNIIFATDKPTEFGGEKRWMWLEVNPQTYETISVSDTGEHMGAGYIQTLMRAIIQGGAKFMAGTFFGVETAIWSVASYSLMYGEYENVLKAAEITTKQIGEHVAKIEAVYSDPLGTVKDLIKEESGLNDLNSGKVGGFDVSLDEGGLKVGRGPVTGNINVADLCNMEFEASIELKIIPGFGDGFNKAAEFYFKLCRM